MLQSTGSPSAHEVVKLGGSLLGIPNWPVHVTELVRDRAARRPVLIVVGGGAIVDGLRAIDRAAPRDAAMIHDLAIELMGTTARLVAAALAVPLVVECPRVSAAVLDVPRWLAFGNRAHRLPADWSVTSDSIAADVAAATCGDLLLAKRVPPPGASGDDLLEALACSGWVDGSFAKAAAPLTGIAWTAPVLVPIPCVGGPAVDRGDAFGR
ncbi:MAG: hypothetical protein WCR51_13055 [Planctomycetia bacterium]